MNRNINDIFKEKRNELYDKYAFYSKGLTELYNFTNNEVSTWEYSLGITRDIIPYESLIPTIGDTKGREITKITKANLSFKRLVSYGLDKFGEVIILKKRYDKDINKYGESVRIVNVDKKGIILNCHIYESNEEKNKLSSICQVYKKENLICYISITPPNDYFIRVDEMNDVHNIKKSSMFATSWFKQLDYDFIYDSNQILEKIMIDDTIHWKAIR